MKFQKTHGMSRSVEYKAWVAMIGRCHSNSHHDYKDWGGRGISVHPAWRADFLEFYREVGPRPSPQHSIDRYPNNEGNYEPGNVRWATPKQQSTNRRSTRFLMVDGERLSLTDAAARLKVNYNTFFWRVKNNRPIDGAGAS